MAYSWIAVEARTGVLLADLPDLDCDSVAVTIGNYTSTDATLPIPTAPENWERATLPGGTCLVLLDGDTDQPVWGGLILNRERTHGDVVSMQLATLEAYFDRRYVGDAPYTNVGQNAIVADLVQRFIVQGTNGGIPCSVVNIDNVPGTLRTRTEYTDDADKTILSVLTELMGVENGPEWTIGWSSSYVAGIRYVLPVLYVGARIGTDPISGVAPAATFDMIEVRDDDGTIRQTGGNLMSFSYKEDWSSSGGATDVLATSSADADTRPESQHVVAQDPDRPTLEYRFTPSTSITNTDTLQNHADAEAAEIFGGVNTIDLTAVADSQRLNVDWFIGDQIGVDIHTPAFPNGLTAAGRASGWQLDFGDVVTVTPTVNL